MSKRERDVLSRLRPQETTHLAPDQERAFQAWASANQVRDVDDPEAAYDYRGYWKAGGDHPIRYGVDHFPDTYKQHGHPTFSVESRYSTGDDDGGRWAGETYAPGDTLPVRTIAMRRPTSTPPLPPQRGHPSQGKRLRADAPGASRARPIALPLVRSDSVPRSASPPAGTNINRYPFYHDTLARIAATGGQNVPVSGTYPDGTVRANDVAPPINRVPGTNSAINFRPPFQDESLDLGADDPEIDFTLGHEMGHHAQAFGNLPEAFRNEDADYAAYRRHAPYDANGPERNAEEYGVSNVSYAVLLHRNHPNLSEAEVASLNRLRPGLLSAWAAVGARPPFATPASLMRRAPALPAQQDATSWVPLMRKAASGQGRP